MSNHSYSHGVGLTPLLSQTIGDNLRATAARYPEADALVVRHQQFRATYRQLWELTTRAAEALLSLAVMPGHRVGIWSTNRFEWVVLQFATARTGAIRVNINPAYLAPELEYALCQSGVSVLFHGKGFRQTDYGPMLRSVRPLCGDLRTVIPFDAGWDEFLALGDRIADGDLTKREASLQFDDPINI